MKSKNEFENITAQDIKSNGGFLRLSIRSISVEELSKMDGTGATHKKIVLHLNTTDGVPFKSFIANRTSLSRLASVEPNPNNWVGLTVVIKCKTIIIPDKLNPENTRNEEQKYIDSVEGFEKVELADLLIKQLENGYKN